MIGPRNTLMAIAGIGPTFGEKYSNPTTLPTGTPTGVAFSPAGDALVVTHANSPFITAYGWSSAGFGAKYANPSQGLVSATPGVAFHPSGSHIFTLRGDPFAVNRQLIAYPWSAATGFGTRLVLGNWPFEIRTLKVSPDGTYIALAGSDTLALHSWTGTGFGGEIASRVEDTASFSVLDIFDSGGTDYIASVGTNTGLWVYPYSGGVLGARFSQGASNQILTGVAFNTPGDFIAWCGSVGGFNIASFVGPGTGAAPGGVGQIPAPSVRTVAFSPLNNAIAVGYNLSPNAGSPLRLYRFTGSRVGNQFAEPSVPPAGPIPAPARSLAFSPSGDALAVVHQNSPFITVYKITYNVP